MCEDERYVGKAQSALSCISLIYYLADFQALILSTLEEGSPFFPLLSYSTCDIMVGLSAFSMGYNVFRAFFQEGRTFGEGNVERFGPCMNTHSGVWGTVFEFNHIYFVVNFICLFWSSFFFSGKLAGVLMDLLILYGTFKFLPSCV